MKAFNQILTATCLLGSAMAQAKLKIMPLGDSITEITCWRTLLWDNLAAAGLTDKFVFVGSMTNNPQNCVGKTSNWDKHHEGHSGYLAVNIANTNLPTWLKSNVPDIVMFMLGTNDVAQGKTTTDITGAYTKMVGELRGANPNVKIIARNPRPSQDSEPIDTVIPLPSGQAKIDALNAAIPAWAKSQNTTASPIWIADCSTGFPSTDLRDGVHPNAAGDQIIASRLTPLLTQVIKQSLNATTATSFAA